MVVMIICTITNHDDDADVAAEADAEMLMLC